MSAIAINDFFGDPKDTELKGGLRLYINVSICFAEQLYDPANLRAACFCGMPTACVIMLGGSSVSMHVSVAALRLFLS